MTGILRLLRKFLYFLALFLVAGPVLAQQPVPALSGRVVDLTGTLDASRQSSLSGALAELENRKGSQIAILMVPSTKPETIEGFGIRVAESWKLGRRGVDDGIILIVAKDDRRVRIEVGYGLEGAVPDALAKRIISEQITPRFRDGDYFGGLLSGVTALVGLIDGEPLPAPVARSRAQREESNIPGLIFTAIFVLFSVAGQAVTWFGELLFALLFGVIAFFAAKVFLSVLFSCLISFVTFVFVFLVAHLLGPFVTPMRSGGYYRGNSWGSIGRSSGGFDIFRGGGGGFGGGGASGSW